MHSLRFNKCLHKKRVFSRTFKVTAAFKVTAIIVLLSLYFLLCVSVASAEEPFELYSEEQPLRDVITAVASHAGLGVKINEEIAGQFSGYLNKRNSYEALDYLSGAFDLLWYSDGSTLYVDPVSAKESKIFQVGNISVDDVKATMKTLALWDEKFVWRAHSEQSMLMVSGPVKYLEIVQQTINLLNEQARIQDKNGLVVKVFKLNYATASDRQQTVRGKLEVIPGVATLLQALALQQTADYESASQASLQNEPGNNDEVKSDKASNEKQRDSERRSTVLTPSPGAARHEENHPVNTSKPGNTGPHPAAAVFADVGTNSVIVQDYGTRMRFYSDLVKRLDVKRLQVEVSLVIIDLTANSLEELGIDWTVAKQSIGSKGVLELILPASNSESNRVVEQTNVEFLSSVTALESQGKARVTSRPAVVTQDGLQAVLDNNESFFVRLQGERVAQLEEITFGTLLQVTPRVIADDNGRQISLDINIEDANRILDGGVDAIPSIRVTRINSFAQVPDGGSLLIGGYYREASSDTRDSIPLLGDLPLLGGMFSHNGKTSSQLIRLFMLNTRTIAGEQQRGTVEGGGDKVGSAIDSISPISKFNSDLNVLAHNQVCESAGSARNRRNQFLDSGVAASVMPCERDNNKYRVLIGQ